MATHEKENRELILEGLSKKETIRAALNTYGFDWCRAALVHGSIGYYTAETSKIALKNYLQGLNPISERCYCCYNADFELMLTCDFRGFEWASLEKQHRVISQVHAMDKMSSEAQMSVSMLYPTHYAV